MLTDEQIEQRLHYMTGSDAPVVCGVSKFQSPYDLWMRKTRRMPHEDISDKPAVKAGNMLEDAIRNWFTVETGVIVYEDNGLLVHSSESWMAGNIDGRVTNERAIFEAKTASSSRGWGVQGENKIPEQYLYQVAHYMAVTDTERCYVAVLIRGIDFRHYVIERDLELERIIIEKEKAFWFDNVVLDSEPDYS